MQFDSISAFFDMGGYGFYVWLSYGVTTLLLAILYFASKAKDNSVKQQIISRQKREEKLRQAAKQHQQNQPENGSNEVLS